MLCKKKNIIDLLTDNIYTLLASTSFLSCTICLSLLLIIFYKLQIISIKLNPFKICLIILMYNIFYIIIIFVSLYFIDKIIK